MHPFTVQDSQSYNLEGCKCSSIVTSVYLCLKQSYTIYYCSEKTLSCLKVIGVSIHETDFKKYER